MVTFGTDFITVTKHSESDWRELEGCIMSTLAPFVDKALAGDAPLIEGATAAATAAAGLDMKDPVVLDIVRVIDERVRPNLEADGGDVQFRGFDRASGVVWLSLVGACATCPSSTITLRYMIRNLLVHEVPEVKDVQPVDDCCSVDELLNPA